MYKRLIAFLILIAVFFGGCGNNDINIPGSADKEASPALSQMRIMTMKIGKADAIIIENRGRFMVIDAGESEDGDKVASYLRSRGAFSIEYMILTHLDKDHIGGAASLIEGMRVENLIQSQNSETSKEFREYKIACERKGIRPILLNEVMEFDFAGARVRLLPGEKTRYKNDNDYSIMAEISYGEQRFLFAGDAMNERLKEYLKGETKPFDFLKVPHHGVFCSMMPEFIKKVSPTYSVITCSEKNPPDDRVMTLLAEAGSEIFLTDAKHVLALTNGNSLTVK